MSAPFWELSLHSQPNPNISPNAEAFTELQHIPWAFTTMSYSFPAVHSPRPQAPADVLPLVLLSERTLRSDNFVQSSEAVAALRAAAWVPISPQWGNSESRQQWEAGSQHSIAGQTGGREPETDLIKGRRPAGGHREGDTHLNNSGTNKSCRLGSVQDGRRSWILMYFQLSSVQNAVLPYNLMLTNQHYFKSIPHKVNKESGYAWFCVFIALDWNSIRWRFWELQVWPLQVDCWNRHTIFW